MLASISQLSIALVLKVSTTPLDGEFQTARRNPLMMYGSERLLKDFLRERQNAKIFQAGYLSCWNYHMAMDCFLVWMDFLIGKDSRQMEMKEKGRESPIWQVIVHNIQRNDDPA